MKAEMDTITIESRQEIRDICKALEEWQESHEPSENVKKMINLLDYMDMVW